MAGAGAGKTQTVVDRCLAWLLDETNGGTIDQILMVTFTNAAAAEMRQRLRQKLEAVQNPPPPRLAEQLALLDTAHICTLHSFCFQLVNRNFYELGLEPDARILPEERATLLGRQALDLVLDKMYAATSPSAVSIQQLIQAQGGDWDAPVRELILRLHHYTQTLRDPAGWFAAQAAAFAQPEPTQWLKWLMEELPKWRASWLALLQAQPPANTKAAECANLLLELTDQSNRSDYAKTLQAILLADEGLWPKPKTPHRDPIKKLFEEAAFLRSICAVGAADPLNEDWQWARHPMLALLDLAGQFAQAFQDAKRREGGIDYHDLEQYALRLLWKNGQPTEIAQYWREKLRLIFVDEYQDINEAQATLIQALGREGAEANRFLVGDVKQSIYGFRLADPRIFTRYHEDWASQANAQVIPLTENFRSQEGILNFINAFFDGLMRKETGGVEYTAEAYLHFGNRAGRAELAVQKDSPPPVELLLRCLTPEEGEESDESTSDAEKEARMVGRCLLELKPSHAWSDMVVLLRSPRNKVEGYAKEFGRLGIPLAAARGHFYESLEVSDLLGLLTILDNPLQDVPLLGVLRSPLVGLTVEELALIRLGRDSHERFWTALLGWHKTTKLRDSHFEKVDGFLRRFEQWRTLSRQSSVSQCLEQIIDQTHYDDWLSGEERGEQRRANVERLLQMTRQFDAYDGESLYRFLKFVEAQQENDIAIEPAASPASDAVRLMSIHQSKGLEFPIVVVGDLGKLFNFSDLHGRIILDEEYGLCPQIQPPETPQFYPSLPHWLAQRRQKRKMLGEEMRLLYVAMTRAEERLILAGTARKSALEKKWLGPAGQEMAARSYLDWLGPWVFRRAGSTPGKYPLLSWQLDSETGASAADESDVSELSDLAPELRERLQWRYPFEAETVQPAKSSVTSIRRQLADDTGAESSPLFSRPGVRGKLSAAEVGLAHHAFLQWLCLEKTHSLLALKEEATRLSRQNLLSHAQIASLDFEALSAFWQSPPGRQLIGQSPFLQRELEFTARFGAAELQRLGCEDFLKIGAGEFVIVQGVVDLAAILPDEIWLLDFKTDHFAASELDGKIKTYRPQIALYAQALERIYRRPVTKSWLHFLNIRHSVVL